MWLGLLPAGGLCSIYLQLSALAVQQFFSCFHIVLHTGFWLILLAGLLVNLVIFMLEIEILHEVIELLIYGCLDLKRKFLEPCFDYFLISVLLLQFFLHPYINHDPDFPESLRDSSFDVLRLYRTCPGAVCGCQKSCHLLACIVAVLEFGLHVYVLSALTHSYNDSASA